MNISSGKAGTTKQDTDVRKGVRPMFLIQLKEKSVNLCINIYQTFAFLKCSYWIAFLQTEEK